MDYVIVYWRLLKYVLFRMFFILFSILVFPYSYVKRLFFKFQAKNLRALLQIMIADLTWSSYFILSKYFWFEFSLSLRICSKSLLTRYPRRQRQIFIAFETLKVLQMLAIESKPSFDYRHAFQIRLAEQFRRLQIFRYLIRQRKRLAKA